MNGNHEASTKARNAPFMRLWVGDYIKDTLHLTVEEDGAYMRLLLATWARNCEWFPDDDKVLSSVVRVPVPQWRKMRKSLRPFFDISTGFWVQNRLAREWNDTQDKINKARENGKRGGRPSKKRTDNRTVNQTVNLEETGRVTQKKANQSQPFTTPSECKDSPSQEEGSGGFSVIVGGKAVGGDAC